MNADKLVAALTVIFVVSVVVLFAALLFLLRRRRFIRPQHDKNHPTDYSAKELLYFCCLKSRTRVEPSGAPNGNPEGYTPDDPVIDVFKLLEANGPSRILCTIKEDDREEIESTSMSVVDSVEIPVTEKVSLLTCLDSEAAAERGAKVDVEVEGDSPMFFTPMGSPAGDGMSSEIVYPV